MKKAILFDADGVLIHTETFSSAYSRDQKLNNEEIFTPFFIGDFQDCLIGKVDLKEIVAPWLSKWNWDGTVDEYLKAWFDFENKPDANMITYVEKLRDRGIVCCLATNQEKYRGNYMKEDMEFSSLFDHCYVSAEVGHKKPSKEYFEHILTDLKTKHGIEAPDVYFTDDSRENVEAANALGIRSHFFTNKRDFQSFLED